MGTVCARAFVLVVAASAVPSAKLPPSRSDRYGRSTASNSTGMFLQRIRQRHEGGGLGADEDSDDKHAMDHMDAIEANAVKRQSMDMKSPASEHFQIQAMDWLTSGADAPRIYILDGGWDRSCEYTETQLGFRYSLEHWAYNHFTKNTAVVVDDPRDADYVYLPHCATGIFMHLAAKDSIEKDAAMEKDFVRLKRRKVNASKDELMSDNSRGKALDILTYEGNLPAHAVNRADMAYLIERVYASFVHKWEFQMCRERENCKFLIVSIYGRHVWRRFASLFGDSAIFITHSGMSDYLTTQWQGHDFFLRFNSSVSDGGSKDETVEENDEGRTVCRAACPEHCLLDPPSVLPWDIVLPWVVAYQWTPRAQQFNSRNLFAFFSGTQNSCSRRQLFQTFQKDFNTLMYDSTLDELHRPDKEPHVLVIPPDFKLHQAEWSELAYRSTLCLVPDGDSPNTGRLIEVIMHGCVPLIISNRLQPPLHEFIDWHSFAFFLSEDDIVNLPSILKDLSSPKGMRRIAERHSNLERAAYFFSYNREGVGGMLFFSLRDRSQRMQQAIAGAVA